MVEVVGSAEIQLRATAGALRRDLRQGRDETRRIARDMQDSANRAEVALTGVGREFSREMTRARASVAGLNGELSQAATLAAAFTAALGGTAAVRSIIEQADAFNLLRARLSTVVAAGESTEAVFARLFAQAQANRAPLANVVDLYTRLRQSIAGLGDTEAASIVQVLSRSLALSGASAAETASFLRQIGQALSSGVLRGEEFNAVLESNARFARLLADQLGVSIGELRGLAEEGRITADVVRSAIAGGAAEIALEYESLPGTVGGAFQQLQNALLRYVGETDSTLGASQRLAEGVSALARNFGDLADAALIAGGVAAAAFVGQRVGSSFGRGGEVLKRAVEANNAANEAALRSAGAAAEQLQRQEDYVAALRREKAELDRLREALQRVRNERREALQQQFMPRIRRFEANGDAEAARRELAAYQREIGKLDAALIRAEKRLGKGLTPGMEMLLGGSVDNRLRMAMDDLRRAQGGMSDAMVRVNAQTSVQTQLFRGLRTGVAGLRTSMASLVSFLGGPWGLAFAAAGAAMLLWRDQADQVRRSAGAVANGLEVIAAATPPATVATQEQANAASDGAAAAGDLARLTQDAAAQSSALAEQQRAATGATKAQEDASRALAETRRLEATATVQTALAEAKLARARAESQREAAQRGIDRIRGKGVTTSVDELRLPEGEREILVSALGRRDRATAQINSLSRSIALLESGLVSLERGFLTVGGGAAAVAQTTPKAAAALVEIRNTAAETGEAVRDVGRSFVELSEEASAPDGDVATPELERAREIALGARDELARLKADLEEVQALTRQGVFSGIGREQDGARALVDLLEQIARASGEAKFALDVLAKAELPGIDRKQAKRDIKRAASDGKAERDEARESYFQPREIRNDLKNAFVEAARSGDWREAFANALETAAGRALGRAVDRTLGGAVDIGLDVAGGLLQKALSAAVKGAASFLPGRAGGGRVYGGQAYETGEAGRELFIPDQSGTVIGARALRAAMSGDGGGKRGGDIYIDARGASPGVETRIRAAIEEAAELGASRGEARVMRRMDAVRSRSR